MNYFSLFGLQTHYQLDNKLLLVLFQNMQRQYHPDKFVNGTREEYLAAVRRSAIINQAWQTLRDPLARAEHLLSLYGIDLMKEQYTEKDTTFLMEHIDMCEELNDIERKKDREKLKKFITHVQKLFNSWHIQMVEQLNNKKWDIAASIVYKLRILNKLRNNAEQLEEKLLYF